MPSGVSSSTVVANMNALRTMTSAMATVSLSSAAAPVCGGAGSTTTTSITISGPAGNLPRPSICEI